MFSQLYKKMGVHALEDLCDGMGLQARGESAVCLDLLIFVVVTRKMFRLQVDVESTAHLDPTESSISPTRAESAPQR